MRHLRASMLFAIAVLAAAGAPAQEPATPGAFDYYLFALSWSPSYCAAHRADPKAREECAKRRGFVVHGLWPQDNDGRWPAFCRPVPPVPPLLVEREATTMPNAELIQHEWAKHGSCTAESVDGYFAALDRARAGLKIPGPLTHPNRPVALAPEAIERLFAAINPGLGPGMMALRCGPRHEFEELRICLDKRLRFRRCDAEQTDTCGGEARFPAIPESAG